jgi:hypothetical protein
MLNDFFKLNEPYERFGEDQLVQHFKTANDIKDVLYQPDVWPNFKALRKVKGKKFTNVSFSKTQIEKITFHNCEFKDCLFIGTQFVEVHFIDCKFTDCNFYKATIEKCYWNPTSVSYSKGYKKTHANLGVILFQSLMKNADTMDQPEWFRLADMEFLRWKRAQLKFDVNEKKIGKLEYWKKYLMDILYERILGYGYRPLYFILVTISGFLFVSAFNFYALDSKLKIDGEVVPLATFWDGIFYTFSIMTLLGFSTITPVTACAKIITVIEAFFSVIWLAVMTSTITKRLFR